MDINEIDDEIVRLEHSEASHSTCGKLANLYIVKDHLTEGNPIPQSYSYAEPSSEFAEIAKRVPVDVLIRVMDEHLETVRFLYPKEYELILYKLKGIL